MKKTIILVAGLTLGMLQSHLSIAEESAMQTTTEITIKSGQLKGLSNEGVTSFYNIPYAKNPFDQERRFQAPQAYGRWDGVLDATAAGQPVPQPSRGREVSLVGAPGDLTLNIWTPTKALPTNTLPTQEPTSAAKLPVMVWLPGGAFIREDAAEQVYNGSQFAKNDVLVVTVNYRVGVDGFMHLEGAPDNRGLLDQIMAIEWVKNNIAGFGGDADQITIAGQSAGAESVAILLGTPKAQGLFQKAIMQSPPMQFFTPDEATRISASFAQKLEIPATIEALSAVPYDKLVATVLDMGNSIRNHDEWGMISWGGTAFLPVADGEIVAGSPMESIARVSSEIPVIVGSTDQEARLYLVPSGVVDRTSEATRARFLTDLSLNGEPLAVYAKQGTEHSVGDSYAEVQSDFTFRMPALHIAEKLTQNGNNVWHYNFSWSSPAFGGKLGAAHFVDVPFMFNNIDTPQASFFLGGQQPTELAQRMHTEWTRFIKSGKPGWTQYNLDTRPVMRFDTQSEQIDNPAEAKRQLWENYRF
ncbi:carboxylesterase/lipase family protein [Amphritea pacifica]|uniref:Carboxylic ester hydrolase n=1 Tax=Amphritea pacifica TaxID=2811233 RepID=A0ABS2W865_9GAMM|nr:carboxylesterase family protein [Amphritea pacifica]MBN0987795.1 carboxylesterase family protein [Amphritea pacifica]MBN1008072.1 carboxylesterase family protein [Amphritea pacifica]